MSDVNREKSIEALAEATKARFRTYIESRCSEVTDQQDIAPDTITAAEWEVQDPTNRIAANLLIMDTSFAARESESPETGVVYGLDFRWDGQPQYAYTLYGNQFVEISNGHEFSFPDDQTINQFLTHLEELEADGHMTRLI